MADNSWIFYAVVTVLLAVIGVCVLVLYRESGSSWERLKALFRNSLTVLWARLLTLGGTVGVLFVSYASDPTVTETLKSYVKPEYWPLIFIGIGLVTELVRSRSLGKDEE